MRTVVAQIFVMQRAYSDLNSSLDDVLAKGRTNARGETSKPAAPLMRVAARGVDAAGSERAGSGWRAENFFPILT